MTYAHLNNKQIIEKYLELKRQMRLVLKIMWSVTLILFALTWYFSEQLGDALTLSFGFGLSFYMGYLATFVQDRSLLSGLYERAIDKKAYQS